jgi:hypothetical protein
LILSKQDNKNSGPRKKWGLRGGLIVVIVTTLFGSLFSTPVFKALLEIFVINPAGALVFTIGEHLWSERHPTSTSSPEVVRVSPSSTASSSPIVIVTPAPMSTPPYEVVSVRSRTGARIECELDSSALDDTSANELSLSFEGAIHYNARPSLPACEVVITSLRVSPTPVPSCLNGLAAVATLNYAMHVADGSSPAVTNTLDSKPECYEADKSTEEDRAARLDVLAELRAALDK